MNEFQAIFTVLAMFVLRFVLPALVLFILIRLALHFYGPDPLEDEEMTVQPRISH